MFDSRQGFAILTWVGLFHIPLGRDQIIASNRVAVSWMKVSAFTRFHDLLRILVKGYQFIQYSSNAIAVNPFYENKKN